MTEKLDVFGKKHQMGIQIRDDEFTYTWTLLKFGLRHIQVVIIALQFGFLPFSLLDKQMNWYYRMEERVEATNKAKSK